MFHWRSKMCSRCASPHCRHTCTRRAKFWTTDALFPWNRPDFSCNRYLEIRSCLWIVCVHIVLQIAPKVKKSGGYRSGECGAHSGSQLRLMRRSGKSCLSQFRELFDVWGVAPSCWNYCSALTTCLRWPRQSFRLLARPCQWRIIFQNGA